MGFGRGISKVDSMDCWRRHPAGSYNYDVKNQQLLKVFFKFYPISKNLQNFQLLFRVNLSLIRDNK